MSKRGKNSPKVYKYEDLVKPECEHYYPKNTFETTRYHMHFQCFHCKGWINIRRPHA